MTSKIEPVKRQEKAYTFKWQVARKQNVPYISYLLRNKIHTTIVNGSNDEFAFLNWVIMIQFFLDQFEFNGGIQELDITVFEMSSY